ncbi:MAG: hypothetical protein JXA44_06655 [Methanospirillaceae archaeon]|nr:hypothetical protein [Methanospirillaceae archaeon]
MDDTLLELWIMMADRVSPQLCCIHPDRMTQLIKDAIFLFSPFQNRTEEAVADLTIVITHAPSGSFAFRQATELLNIIEWQRRYHPDWKAEPHPIHGIHSGRHGLELAHALALLQAGADSEVISVTQKIADSKDQDPRDQRIARLIRAASWICNGYPEKGEAELIALRDI